MIRRVSLKRPTLVSIVILCAANVLLHSTWLVDPALAQVRQAWVDHYDSVTFNSQRDDPVAVAVDDHGNVYVAGYSCCASIPLLVILKIAPDGTPLWQKRWGSPDGVGGLVVDAAGNAYVSSWSSSGWVTFKTRSDGSHAWDRPTAANRPYALELDGLGNVLVAGDKQNASANDDYVTVKFDSDGTELWTRTFDGAAAARDVAYALAVDAINNVYVTGESYGGGAEAVDFVTVKYAHDGTELWAERYNGGASGDDIARTIVADQVGNVYVAGESWGGAGTAVDFATVKYANDGTQLWARRYDGPANGSDLVRSIGLDSSGNVYVTGESAGGPVTGTDYATVKYAPDGTELWVQRYNGSANSDDQAAALATDDVGNVYVTGVSDGGPTTRRDYATIKYSSNGTPLWVKRYDRSAGDHDIARNLVLDDSGAVHVTGSSFSGGPFGTYDYTTLKYAQGGYVLDGFGGVHSSDGAAAPVPPAPYFGALGLSIARDIETADPGLYVLDGFGGVSPAGGAPTFFPATPYFGFDIAVDLELSTTGFYVLDGFGGVHAGGGAEAITPATPFFGADIARALEITGTGLYVLDGLGGLHAGGNAPVLAPLTPYFGFDIARDLELSGSGFYVLDGYGGMHAGGAAPTLNPATPYFGFDIARDLELDVMGFYVLDGYGGIHAGGEAIGVVSPSPYFGFDIARSLALR